MSPVDRAGSVFEISCYLLLLYKIFDVFIILEGGRWLGSRDLGKRAKFLSFNSSISIQFCMSRIQDCIDYTAAVS